MPYVQRDASGAIQGIYANLQDYAKEFLDDSDPAVQAFLTPNPVPQEVTNIQARLALRQSGLIDQANTAVKASTPDVQDMWEYSATIKRQNPQLLTLAQKLNLTSTALDHLFTIAATL